MELNRWTVAAAVAAAVLILAFIFRDKLWGSPTMVSQSPEVDSTAHAGNNDILSKLGKAMASASGAAAATSTGAAATTAAAINRQISALTTACSLKATRSDAVPPPEPGTYGLDMTMHGTDNYMVAALPEITLQSDSNSAGSDVYLVKPTEPPTYWEIMGGTVPMGYFAQLHRATDPTRVVITIDKGAFKAWIDETALQYIPHVSDILSMNIDPCFVYSRETDR